MSQRIWLISDTHFYHTNVIKYSGRPFETTEQMNRVMINNWNRMVKKQDYIYHLGDFGFSTAENLREIVSKLNGVKILVKGNHDRGSFKKYLDLGFDAVYANSVLLNDRYLLSHRPIELEEGSQFFNIHGHIHQHNLDSNLHFNASVEQIEYTPILFEKVKKILTSGS